MALTAKLYADFGNFYDAVKQAEVVLKSFEDESHKVEDSLNRMVDKFTGRKLVQDATLMVEAIERVGGVSKLTQDELARVSAKAAEAAEKLRAMGQDVPAGIQKIADESKRASGETSGWNSTLSTLAGTFGALSLQRIIDETIRFGQEILNNATQLTNLRDRTDVSVETLQRLQKVGSDTGVSLDTMATAMGTMRRNLGEGDASTVGALAQLGLNLDTIKKLGMEDAFFEVAAALRDIKDPTDQARIGNDLLGKSFEQMRPAIKKGFDDTKDSAESMSRSTVQALADTKKGGSDVADYFKGGFSQVMADVLTGTTEGFRRMKDSFEDMAKKTVAAAGPNFWGAIVPPGLPKDIAAIIEQSDAWAESTKKVGAAMVTLNDFGLDWYATLQGIDGEVVEAAKYYLEAGAAQKDIADAFGLTAGQVRAVASAMKDAQAIQKLWQDFEKESHDLFLKHWQEEEAAKKKQTSAMNDTVIAGMRQIKNAQAELNDSLAKSTLSTTDYQLLKVKESAAAQIAAFKGTADQAAAYAEVVTATAKRQSDAIIASATAALDVVAKKGMDAMAILNLAANQVQRGMAVDVVGNAQTAGLSSGVGMQSPIYVAPPIFARAAGGPVSSGQPYMVGERGPELFVPSTSGGIVPNGRAGIVQNITIHVNGTAADVARQVSDEIMRQAMRGQQFGAS